MAIKRRNFIEAGIGGVAALSGQIPTWLNSNKGT
jgi:hypothetical protein